MDQHYKDTIARRAILPNLSLKADSGLTGRLTFSDFRGAGPLVRVFAPDGSRLATASLSAEQGIALRDWLTEAYPIIPPWPASKLVLTTGDGETRTYDSLADLREHIRQTMRDNISIAGWQVQGKAGTFSAAEVVLEEYSAAKNMLGYKTIG